VPVDPPNNLVRERTHGVEDCPSNHHTSGTDHAPVKEKVAQRHAITINYVALKELLGSERFACLIDMFYCTVDKAYVLVRV
jgi:hypothetical protein